MSPESVSPKNRRRALALSVALFLFSVYLFSYRGGFHSVDEAAMYAVTESMAKLGRFNIDQIAWIQWTTSQAEAQGFFGQDGHVYSKKGLALSLAQAPLYWLALLLPLIGMLQTVSLLNALITAASGLLIFMFLHRLDFPLPTAVITALIFGLATIATVYAKYLFSEPLAGFLLLLAAYILFAYRQEGGLRHVVIAGLAAGFAVVTRANNFFALPIFGLYLIWIVSQPIDAATNRKSQSTKHVARITYHALRTAIVPLAVFIVATIIPGAILMGYNAIRSGNPLDTGYDLSLFSRNILLGLYKLLFSPLRGLFVYTPILFLSLPGWWYLRKTWPAEAWFFVGLIGVNIALFSAWSSGEGLSWGSRFLVPVVPFFVMSLAPIVEKVLRIRGQSSGIRGQILRFSFYALLPISLFIQLLGIAMNPWVFLAQLQEDFGGEFFLERTAALYDFRYSQIFGQLQLWSLENSDLAWWQPWGFDGLAFSLSLGLVLFSGWLLWQSLTGARESGKAETKSPLPGQSYAVVLLTAVIITAVAVTYILLARYYHTDLQFGPPNDAYTRALKTAVSRSGVNDQIATVAQYHYHVPMNRFKANVTLTGFGQQTWPPPQTALPLLRDITAGQNVWLVTIGFQPAASDNAAEQWLTENTFNASDEWLDDSVRLVRFTSQRPTTIRPIKATLGANELQLADVRLVEALPAGQALPVEFVWLPLTQPQTDYILFLQLLNADGALVAQHDSPPNGGYHPTTTWQVGQPITTRHALVLPPDLPPADYRLITGLYNSATGTRLPASDGRDFIDLGIITVER